jgi:hypothetical protein
MRGSGIFFAEKTAIIFTILLHLTKVYDIMDKVNTNAKTPYIYRKGIQHGKKGN